MRKQIMIGLLIGLSFLFVIPVKAQATEQNEGINPKTDTIVVGVAGSEPFVMKNKMSKEYEGIAVDVWEDMAFNAGWNYRYKPYETVAKALNAVEKGKVDMVVGPISITSDRAKDVGFSQPYFNSSLSIISLGDQGGIWSHIKPLLSLKLLYAVAGFLFILAIVGTLFWLAERKKSPDYFSEKPGKGIGQGMYLAIVTMSTVGYGDLAPRSAIGRIIAGTWIVLAIVFATSMVAGIASTLTLAINSSTTINTIEELAGQKTATVAGSPATGFIKEHHGKLVEAETLDKAMELLEHHKVEAVVYDRPLLMYYNNNHPEKDLYLANAEYYKQGYGFAFPLNSTFIYPVNLQLLQLSESQKVKKAVDAYIGEED